MPQFSANLGFLFTEHPFVERIDAAARAGFKGVEFGYPYDFDRARIVDGLKRHRLAVAVINTPPGNFAAGERGMACDPARRGEFQDSICQAADWGTAVGTAAVHVLAGKMPPDQSRARLMETYIENMRFAAAKLAEKGIKATMEAINSRYEIPNYLLDSPSEAVELIAELAIPNLYLQFDFYHAQIVEGDLTILFTRAFPHVGHIQIADVPGRHEPGSGEINYAHIFRRIDDLGYEGWVGCEYKPKAGTVEGLSWMAASVDGGKRRG
ncbi:MAG: hydroxypyruvate isomerase [Rhodospirillales bacterium]|nr:hydroxypyruvate isomerase [Rhodospirillales bacterium]